MDGTSARPIRLVGRMIQWPQSETKRKGRGGRRLGAGRKPNRLKRVSSEPITVAEIIARRHPESAALTPKELAALQSITSKLAEPSPDGRGNQKESTKATFEPPRFSSLNLLTAFQSKLSLKLSSFATAAKNLTFPGCVEPKRITRSGGRPSGRP
jgi:hypothetical protein